MVDMRMKCKMHGMSAMGVDLISVAVSLSLGLKVTGQVPKFGIDARLLNLRDAIIVTAMIIPNPVAVVLW